MADDQRTDARQQVDRPDAERMLASPIVEQLQECLAAKVSLLLVGNEIVGKEIMPGKRPVASQEFFDEGIKHGDGVGTAGVSRRGQVMAGVIGRSGVALWPAPGWLLHCSFAMMGGPSIKAKSPHRNFHPT